MAFYLPMKATPYPTQTSFRKQFLENTLPLDKIKPTIWDELKTDGIDFSKKLLWLDDNLCEGELKVLEKNNATDNFVLLQKIGRVQRTSFRLWKNRGG